MYEVDVRIEVRKQTQYGTEPYAQSSVRTTTTNVTESLEAKVPGVLGDVLRQIALREEDNGTAK